MEDELVVRKKKLLMIIEEMGLEFDAVVSKVKGWKKLKQIIKRLDKN